MADSQAALAALRHLHKEFLVVLRSRELLEQEDDRLIRWHVAQKVTQEEHAIDLLLREEQLFLACARLVDVDSGEDTAVGDLAVEHQLHVPRPLELLEDHLVHSRPGLDERGGDDRERSASLDVSGGSEEPLGLVQGGGFYPARENLARMR